MNKPVLIVMAAGMGSRYGGLKQIDPVDSQGKIIIDYSIYDAIHVGFEKVVFIIKKVDETDFRSVIGDRISDYIDVQYVYQELDNLPSGYKVPEGRTKPWGTGHALLSCLGTVHEPMVVINADDFYGRHAFEMAYDFLSKNQCSGVPYSYMMVGYLLENTLTDNGSVARGICVKDNQDYLVDINERTHIERQGSGVAYTEDGGTSWTQIPAGSTVSMNMWGFTPSILSELNIRFEYFLQENLDKNPLTCEYFLPSVVDELLQEKKATVKVMQSVDQWFGVTYKEDKPVLMKAIQEMKYAGLYPQNLWED